MALTLQQINIGSIANDGTGDDLRTAGDKINSNSDAIFDALSGSVAGGTFTGPEKLLGLDGGGNKAWLVSQLATFIAAEIVDSAPGTLDTLNELATALGDDPNFAATMTAALAGKQPLDSDLTAIAALTTTSFGRARLADADGAALARAALVAPQIETPVSGATLNWADDQPHLICDHAATIASLTINLPANPRDGQRINLMSRSAASAATISGNGKTIVTNITTFAAGGHASWVYAAANSSWYRAD